MEQNTIDSHELAHLLKMREQAKMAQVAHDSHMMYLQSKYNMCEGDAIDLISGHIKRIHEKEAE